MNISSRDDIYIPRKYLKVLLKKSALYSRNSDLFVIDAVSFDDLPNHLGLPKDKFCKWSDVTEQNISEYKYITTGNLEKLAVNTDRNVHYVEFEKRISLEIAVQYYSKWMVEHSQILAWRGSTGSVENLEPHLIENEDDTFEIEYDEFLGYFFGTTVLVCAAAGAGKTVEIKRLVEIQGDDVSVIDLESYTDDKFSKINEGASILLDNADSSGEKLKMLQNIKKRNVRTLIFSRECYQHSLEDALQTFAIRLKPFDKNDQMDYLHDYFGDELDVNLHENYLEFPLNLQFWCVIYEHVHQKEVNDVTNLYELYLSLIKMNTDETSYLALQLFLKEESDINLHRVLIEYLAAKWLYNHYREPYAKRLIKQRLFEPCFKNVRWFFDQISTIGSVELSNIVKGNLHVVNDTNINSKDSLGRSVLHFLVAYHGKDNINYKSRSVRLDLIKSLSNKNNVLLEDEFNITPLHLAKKLVYTGAMTMFKYILNETLEGYYSSYYTNRFDLSNASENHIFTEGRNALHVSVEFNHVNRLKNYDYGVEDDMGRTPFHVSVDCGHFSLVQFLYRNEYDVDKTTFDGLTPLMVSSQNGHVNIVNWLLDNNVDVNKVDYDGQTSLIKACNKGYIEVVRSLLTHNADSNIADKEGWTALFYACLQGFIDIFIVLINHGANIHHKGKFGGTALVLAAQNGHLQIVKDLLKLGADMHVKTLHMNSLLYRAADNEQKAMVEYLIKAGAVIDEPEIDGITPLMAACHSGNLEIVKVLLFYGADLNIVDNNKFTPLMCALVKGHTRVIKFLLEQGLDLHAKTSYGDTVVLFAALHGHLSLLKFFITQGANIHDKDSEGFGIMYAAFGNIRIMKYLLKTDPSLISDGLNAFLNAARQGDIIAVKFLISNNVPINGVNDEGKTAVYHSAEYGKYKTVTTLVENGADFMIAARNEVNPLLIALRGGHYNIARYLMRKGADFSFSGNCKQYCRQAFFKAVSDNQDEIMTFLISKGVEIDKPNSEGLTAIMIAEEKGFHNIIELLRQG